MTDVLQQDIESQDFLAPWCIRVIEAAYGRLQNIRNTSVPIVGVDGGIEYFPLGYPRFCSLIGAHPAFSISRRFSRARARLLLAKQDRVSRLEGRLDELDLQESRMPYLASFERDGNQLRKEILRELDKALKDYDEILERNVRILQLPTASKGNVTSLLNWVQGTGSIARSDTTFLLKKDLCAVGGSGNHGLVLIESVVTQMLATLYKCLWKHDSKSPNVKTQGVFIFTGSVLMTMTHFLVTALVVLLLLIPILAMRSIDSTTVQILCILIASIIFNIVLSGPMNAKPAEVFMAGTSYAALLVVFLSSNEDKHCK